MKQVIPFVKVVVDRLPTYTPPGHDNTHNRKVIGAGNGAKHTEIIVGEMGRGGHASPHTHDTFEQSMFMLEGKLEITGGDGTKVTLEPGEAIFFPAGCEHQIVSVAEKSRFVIVYSPPRPS